MDRTERFHRITELLRHRGVVSLADMMRELEVSRATIRRDLTYMRNRMQIPIKWDRNRGGYIFTKEGRQELPGLWFNSSEAYALLTMDHLLTNLQPGLLDPHIEPLRASIRRLLDLGDHEIDEVIHRLRILPHSARMAEPRHFEAAAKGVLERRRLNLSYRNRQTGDVREREISPQRLVYYRACWYLDAWCHWRKGLRSFAMDAVQGVQLLQTKARNLSEKLLDAELASGYGIYSGRRTYKARLRFSAQAACWVAQECWHPEQEFEFDKQGRYLLTVPYSHDTELIMDVLRHGGEVEVLAPKTLRRRVQQRLAGALAVYDD